MRQLATNATGATNKTFVVLLQQFVINARNNEESIFLIACRNKTAEVLIAGLVLG